MATHYLILKFHLKNKTNHFVPFPPTPSPVAPLSPLPTVPHVPSPVVPPAPSPVVPPAPSPVAPLSPLPNVPPAPLPTVPLSVFPTNHLFWYCFISTMSIPHVTSKSIMTSSA